MSLETILDDLVTVIATKDKKMQTEINGNAADLSGLTTTDKSSLMAAINEVKAAVGAGSPTTLDDLTDVAITTPSTGHVLRHNGTNWVNTLGTSHFDAAGTAAAAVAAIPTGSASAPSLVELATDAEAIAGTDTARATTPANLAAVFSNRIATSTSLGTSNTLIPSQNAVKSYVDTAVAGATIADASETVKGKVELATNAEAVTGTDTARAVTPANVAAVFSDRIDTSTSLGSSNTKVASQAAVKTYVDGVLDANNAYQYKGLQDCSANPNYPAASAGWTYKVSVAGKIGGASGPVVEVGDSLVCLVDSTSAGNHATVGANWMILQTNIDGAVVGPASSTAGNLVSFAGSTGKTVQDTGITTSTDGTFSANSDTMIPTQKAIKTYADTRQPLDATLTAFAGLTITSGKLPYGNGSDTFATTDLTAAGRALLDDADTAAQRTTLDVWSKTEIGSVTKDYAAAYTAQLT